MTLRLTDGSDIMNVDYLLRQETNPIEYTVQSVVIEVCSAPCAPGDSSRISLNMSDVKKLSSFLQRVIDLDEAQAEQ